jgi:hypothetical protein
MIKKFIVEKGNLGSDGIQVDISGMTWNNPVKVLHNFVRNEKIGECNLSIDDDGFIVAEMDLDSDFISCYPAIGFKKHNETNECQIICVALCNKPNCDETILPIL